MTVMLESCRQSFVWLFLTRQIYSLGSTRHWHFSFGNYPSSNFQLHSINQRRTRTFHYQATPFDCSLQHKLPVHCLPLDKLTLIQTHSTSHFCHHCYHTDTNKSVGTSTSNLSSNLANSYNARHTLPSLFARYFNVNSSDSVSQLLYLHCGMDESKPFNPSDDCVFLPGDFPKLKKKHISKKLFFQLFENVWADPWIQPLFTEHLLMQILRMLIGWPIEGGVNICNEPTRRMAFSVLSLLSDRFGTEHAWPALWPYNGQSSSYPPKTWRKLSQPYQSLQFLFLVQINSGLMDYDVSLDMVRSFNDHDSFLKIKLIMMLVEGLITHGNYNQVEHFIQQACEIWKMRPPMSVYLSLFKAYARKHEFGNANRIFLYIQEKWWPLPMKIYTLMLMLYLTELRAQARHAKPPLKPFEMTDTGEYLIRPTLQLRYYDWDGETEHTNKDLEAGARKLLQTIQESTYQKDTLLYDVMVDVYACLGEFPQAIELFGEMRSSADFNPKRDTATYSILIEALFKYRYNSNVHSEVKSNPDRQMIHNRNVFPKWHASMSVPETLQLLLSDMAFVGIQLSIHVMMGILWWNMKHSSPQYVHDMIVSIMSNHRGSGEPVSNSTIGYDEFSKGIKLDLTFYDMCIRWAMQHGNAVLVDMLVKHAYQNGIPLSIHAN
ncbi:hypothetical protein O5D80_001753 [Batrachochytrium dendrobatidis]|nr:hypothetical protein O5D80_001753 [Batrachochytrium dendrobatidis]